MDLFCCWGENFRFPPHIVFPVLGNSRCLSEPPFVRICPPEPELFLKVLNYLYNQRHQLTSPYTMTKRITYHSNTAGGQVRLTAGGDHRVDLPTNFRLQKTRVRPDGGTYRKRGKKIKDRFSMLRPLFLIEATRSTHTPIASLARLVGLNTAALRCYRSQILRGKNSEKKVSENVRTAVRTALTLDQA